MNKRMGHNCLTGLLVAGFILLTPSILWSQVAGRVQKFDGSALAGATVEVWDSYPSGSILGSGTTNAQGDFSVGAVAGGAVDVRVRKSSHYPTVVRELIQPTTNTSLHLMGTPQLNGNPIICDFYHAATTFLGSSVAVGDIVESITQGGAPCGVGTTLVPGGWLTHAFGDDPATQSVDGPFAGEQMSFRINGLPATLNNAPVVFSPNGNMEAQLNGPVTSPGVTLVGPLAASGTAGGSAFILFEVTNTGSQAGNFTVEIELDQAWNVTVQSVAGLGLNLNPGESADVLAEVEIPQGTPDQFVEIRARVSADTYGQANSGAWTMLEVTTTSDVGDGGNGVVPKSFSLLQNYPNPFNAGTTISFTLEQGGIVNLSICNLLGQTMCTLINEHREPGIYSEIWDGRDDRGQVVASGIYFSRLLQSEQSQVRKMVLLK